MMYSKLQTAVAVLALIFLTLLFFWKILLTNLILAGVDTFLYFYPYKAYVAEALRQDRLPLWNPHLFMGAPLLANSQVGLFYPFNWLFIWLDVPKQVAWSIGLHIALAGLLMLTYTRLSLQLSGAGSAVAALLFAFGGYLGAQVEHINQLNAAVWLPLLFLLYDLALARPHRRWFWFLWLAVAVAVTLLAGHAQTVFISLFGLGLYGLWRAFSPFLVGPPLSISRLRSALLSLRLTLLPLLPVSLLAVALAAIQLVPTAELSGLSIRSGGLTYREVVSFSLRPTVLHYGLLPPLGLDLSQALGEAFGEWVAYLGIGGLVLVLLGVVRSIWQPAARRFLFVAGSGLVLSLGAFSGPLYLTLYYLMPGFNLFRVPARWLLLYAFGAAVLAGFGFDALLRPASLRYRLAVTWSWLRSRRWRGGFFIGLPLIGLLALIAWRTPPLTTLTAWLVLLLLACSLIYYLLRLTPYPTVTPQHPTDDRSQLTGPGKITLAALILLLLGELFWAAQTLNYNHPTAPQAYHSLRNAVAFLLATDPPDQEPGPPGRFLSLSGITYDPGDMAELTQIFGDSLSEKGLYNLLVATKEKEVLFFNLPLLYNLHSVDGYDGGILPLEQFVTLQRLFLPPDDLSIDGRLREKLRFVPEGRLLSLLNTRWIITDKQFDVWIDDIFYDLQFPARLRAGETVTTTAVPNFPTTAIGLVSHLEGGAGLPDGTVVAKLAVTFTNGSRQSFTVRAGEETAEGSYPSEAAHSQAQIGVAWPYGAQGVDYIAIFPLTTTQTISRISLSGTLPEGWWVGRGLSLINRPTSTSRSVILSTEGAYRQVHSGDVKIYENLAVLPRAFLVHQAEVVSNDQAAIAAIKDPRFDPAAMLVRQALDHEQAGLIRAGQPSGRDQVTIVSYRPERVELATTLETPGWLTLTDAYYPGWQATVDGQPTEIFQANLMFRGIAVPAGSHTVLFEFKPRSFQIGALITGLAGVVLVAGLVIMMRVPKF